MRIHPFFAAYNLGRLDNMRVVPGRVRKEEPLLREGYFEKPSVPWEQRIDNGYPNAFYDEAHREFRLYYTCFIRDDASTALRPEARIHEEYAFYRKESFRPRLAGILLLTSEDGRNWIRPSLGVCEFEGAKDNNILMTGVHGASVFRDERESDPQRRYKMAVRHDVAGKMAVSFSADGIHFCDPIDWEGESPAGDTHNFAFFDESTGRYALITRTWADGALRLAARSESDDFVHWSKPIEIYRGDGLDDQIYSMPLFQSGELYLGLGSILHGGDRAAADFDCVDLELLYSVDGRHFNRACAGLPLIPRGAGVYGDGAPDCGCIYASTPVKRDGKFIFYYYGGNGQHTNFRETSLMRAVCDPDALAGCTPRDARGGAVSTCNLRVTGDNLFLKAELASNARVRACVSAPASIHARIEPLEGFDFSDAELSPAGENLWRVSFARPLSALGDAPRMVTFRAENAILYGFGGDVAPIRRAI